MIQIPPPEASAALRLLLDDLRERKATLDKIISELVHYARIASTETNPEQGGRRKAHAVMRMPNPARRKSA